MWLPIPKFCDEILAVTKLLILFPEGAPARTAATVFWIVSLDYAIASAFSIASKDIVLEDVSNEHLDVRALPAFVALIGECRPLT